MGPRRDLVNAETFTRLRISEGLSRKALGKAAGVSETVVAGIERGLNHPAVSLGVLKALADALGSTISALTRPPGPTTTPTPDDASLEAALAFLGRPARTHEVAHALGWPLERTRAAAGALADRLHATGQTLIHTGWDQLRLVSADALSTQQRLRLAQSSGRARGLTPRTAAVLAAFLADELNASWLQHASRNERIALGALLNMGILEIVHTPHTRVVLSQDFRYLALRLDKRDRSAVLSMSLDS